MKRTRPLRPWALTRTGAGALLTIADRPALTSGAMVVDIDCALSDWTPGADVVLARHGTTDGDLSWSVEILAGGRPRASWYDLGTLATRVGNPATSDPADVLDGRRAMFRFHMLSDIFGVASINQYEWISGARLRSFPSTVQGALVGVPFDSSEPITVAADASITKLYAARVYVGAFGPSQFANNSATFQRVADSQLPLHRGDTSWVDPYGSTITVGPGAGFVRSDAPLGYVA